MRLTCGQVSAEFSTAVAGLLVEVVMTDRGVKPA